MLCSGNLASGISGAMDLQTHQHVLQRRQAAMQVVGLEDEAQAPPHRHEVLRTRAIQLMPQQID